MSNDRIIFSGKTSISIVGRVQGGVRENETTEQAQTRMVLACEMAANAAGDPRLHLFIADGLHGKGSETCARLFEQFRDIYCGRTTYVTDCAWVANMDVIMKEICKFHGLSFESQEKV